MTEAQIIRRNAGIVLNMARGMNKKQRRELYAMLALGPLYIGMAVAQVLAANSDKVAEVVKREAVGG